MSKSDMSNFSLLQLETLWLIDSKPNHSYKLLQILSKKLNRKVTNGALHPILKKLLQNKFIKVKSKGNRGKKVYSITSKGRKALHSACKEFCAVAGDMFAKFVCLKCGTKIK